MKIEPYVNKKEIANDQLLDITKSMPMKQINIKGKPYLQRYYAGTFRDDKDLWIHRFLSCDGDQDLHSHPFDFETIILNGSYTEELEELQKGVKRYDIRMALAGIEYPPIISRFSNMLNNVFIGSRPKSEIFKFICGDTAKHVSVYDWHRIAAVEPLTWTAMIVDSKRLPMWFFKDGDDVEPIPSSPRDWHKNYAFRPESGVCSGDNDNSLHNLF